MKRGILLIVLSWILLIVFSSFVSACDDNQTILRLYSESNAHGAVWNQTAYLIQICYDRIFEEAYTGENPHSCAADNSNLVLKLSSETNAHAEIKTLNNYNTIVCYGDLTCNARTSCNSDEKLIASLHSETNAHLANSTSYSRKICCKSVPAVVITQAQWADMNNNLINETDINDSVKLVVSGAGLQEVNYTIKKDLAFWFDKKIATISSTLGELVWQAGKKSDGTFSEGNYYFIANIEGKTKRSGILSVGAENNFEPLARINKPLNKQIYFLNEFLNFSQESYDKDDVLYYSWNLGDGATRVGNSENKANYSFEYAYSTPGQKNIVLRAWNSRGQETTNRTSILIINSSLLDYIDEPGLGYVLAYIDEPKFGLAYGKTVNFNASSSYAVNPIKKGYEIRTIFCLAGACPEKTAGCPPGSGQKPDCQITIKNSDGSNPPNLAGFENLEFSWVFDNNFKNNKTAKGMQGAFFKKPFAKAGQHSVDLTVRLNALSTTSSKFNVYFENPFCYVENNEETFWIDGTSITSSSNSCFRAEGLPTTDCCPVGYSCIDEKCAFSGVEFCSDYTEEECKKYSSAIAINDVESLKGEGYCEIESLKGECLKYVECMCLWNSTNGCVAAADFSTRCGSEEPGLNGTCIFPMTEETNCTSGYKFVKWTEIWNGAEAIEKEICDVGEHSKQVACLSEALLSFYNNLSLILTILIIIIFYIVVWKKKKKYGRKKKKYK